jgi:glyoxylase-like metal-dependent hydrolase (beta-lactamase superfamily II)
VLITGDVLFAGSIGRSDFKGGDIRALEASLNYLSGLEKVDLVLPGHGPAVVGADRIKANFKTVRRFFE